MGRAAPKPKKVKEPKPPAPEERGSDAMSQSIPRRKNPGRSSTVKAAPQADPLTRDLEGKDADEPAQAQAARTAEDLEEEGWDVV
jgi:hypothetical protein